MALSKMTAEPMDLESTFDNEPMPLNDEVLAIADFGDLRPSQLDACMDFSCPQCNKMFSSRENLRRHVRAIHLGISHVCQICKKSFNRSDHLRRHLKTHDHSVKTSTKRTTIQEVAGPSIAGPSNANLSAVRQSKRQCPEVRPPCLATFDEQKLYPSQETASDIRVFLDSIRSEIIYQIQNVVLKYYGIKWYISVCALMVRLVTETEEEMHTAHFRSKCAITLREETPNIQEAIEKVLESYDEFQGRGSGWLLHSVQYLELKTAIYQPLAASSYLPLPKILADKKAIINIQNEDEKCLLWCVLASLYPVGHTNHPQRVSNYRAYEKELNVDGILFPTPLHQLEKFEKLNDLSINVFGFENNEVLPLRITSNKHGDRHINLLLISEGETRHYTLIKSMSRLLYGLTKHHGAVFYCDFCLHRFIREESLQAHIQDCRHHGAQKIKMPENKWLTFDKPQFQLPVPYVAYADFESVLVKQPTCLQDPEFSSTSTIAHHIPSGGCYCIIGPDGHFYKQPQIFQGENSVKQLVTALLEDVENIFGQDKKAMNFSNVDLEDFNKATLCHICKKPLNGDKVRDHDHISGKFRGAAHNSCNLNYKQAVFLPVFFHNLKGYDGHLLVQALGQFKDQPITVIPSNSEKYISFSLGKLRFLDSFQFLSGSLDKLTSTLEQDRFKLTSDYFRDKAKLMLRKGVYPYEYMDGFDKLQESALPPIESFFSELTQTAISAEEYEHAHQVWKAFKCKNLGDYQDIYIASDVVLLADIFQNFRDLSIKFYELDPAHCYTAPGLAWQAALKMTGVTLELLQDPDMYLFIEKGIRGGIAMISHRYAKANNHYMEDFDVSKPSSHIIYLDANNLYGWAMSQTLPTHNFQWHEGPINFMEISDDAPEGCILEVDLEYPEHLHDSHSDYPLAPEQLLVTEEMMSQYQRNLCASLNIKPGKTSKLCPNLLPKTKYIVHYRNLKLYVSLGLIVKKIHRVLTFKQSAWLAPYISFNTEQRKLAKTKFEKDLFKLLNNAVFGKTMENLRNRVNIDLVSQEKKAKKLVAAPTFHSFKVISQELVAIERRKNTILLNRPIYCGFAILDLSKMLMYSFHYNHIKVMYGSKAQLLFTDTDSLCYCIETDDIYRDMARHIDLYDTSEYPSSHALFTTKNMKIIGKFKDELAGQPAEEFIGLKPKMYSLLSKHEEKKTAKGVAKIIRDRQIRHTDYYNCLFLQQRSFGHGQRFASSSHHITTVSYTKVTLCPLDTKRYIKEDGISSLAYGHYKICN